jgi:hypothetical protein
LPRFGFAYQLNDKTVLRGGMGLYQGFLGERRGDVIQPGYTQTTVQQRQTGPNGAPLPYLLTQPFVDGITEASGNALGKQTALGQTVTFFNQNPKVAKQLRYTFGVQRELWGGWFMEFNYLGNKGSDIEIGRNLNATSNSLLNLDNSRTAAQEASNTVLGGAVSNPFCTNISGSTCSSGALYTGAGGTISRRTLLSPYPEFGAINSTTNDGESWYNSAQFSLDKRFAKGYGIQLAYTYSKWLEATDYLNAADERPSKFISSQDVPHRFSSSFFYELPFGKGQYFASGVNNWANAVIGGWQIQGTYTFQSGFPVTLPDMFYKGGRIALDKDQQTLSRWFNTDAFVSVIGGNPTCGAFATANVNCATPVNHFRTLPLRFSELRIDAINNMDFGLRKDIHIREGMKVQLRMEFINGLNHPLFPGPNVTPSSTAFGTVSASNLNNYARRAQMLVKFIF